MDMLTLIKIAIALVALVVSFKAGHIVGIWKTSLINTIVTIQILMSLGLTQEEATAKINEFWGNLKENKND